MRKIVTIYLLMIVVMLFLTSNIGAAEPDFSYTRPDKSDILTHLENIKSDPEFRVSKSFFQELIEKLFSFKLPKFDISPKLSKTISFVLFAWCILTISALVIHLIWSIWLIARPEELRVSISGQESTDIIYDKTFQELREMAQAYFNEKEYAKAIEMLMAALLKGLDSAGILRFHESKTNGDFIREYPADISGRKKFTEFIRFFDQAVYGRDKGYQDTFIVMENLMEQIYTSVSKET